MLVPRGSNPTAKTDQLSSIFSMVSRPYAVGIICFLVVLLTHLDALSEPPAWDAAMGMYPAAITLAESGFDYADLLTQPGFVGGGPNVHATSILTLVAAVLIALFGAPHAYVLLHLLSFAMAGVAGAALARLAIGLNAPERLAAALAGLTVPLVFTQFAFIYLEAPLLATTAMALSAATRRKNVAALGWATLATLLKPTGVIAAATVSAILWRHAPSGRKLKSAAGVLLPSLLILAGAIWSAPPGDSPSFDLAAAVARGSAGYLMIVPDVLLLLVLGFLLIPLVSSSDRTEPEWLSPLSLSFMAAHTIPLLAGYAVLPRYYGQIIPLAVLSILLWIHRRFGTRPFWYAASLLVVLNLANFSGRFYPGGGSENFAVAERSAEYRGLLEVQQRLSVAVSALDPEIQVFYGQPENYRQAYPDLGYAADPHPRGTFVATRNGLDLANLPSPAFLVLDIPFRGGIAIFDTLQAALQDPRWTVTITRLTNGDYTLGIAHLERSE